MVITKTQIKEESESRECFTDSVEQLSSLNSLILWKTFLNTTKVRNDQATLSVASALIEGEFPKPQPAITCSKLATETLKRRCEICSKLAIKTSKRRQWN